MNDLRGQIALVTGGTRGIGLSAALALAAQGAQLVVTHRWGSVSENELNRLFTNAGHLVPMIVEADVANEHDTQSLLSLIHQHFGRLDIFISNVCIAGRSNGFEELRLRDLRKSLDYSVLPTKYYLEQIEAQFGKPPRATVCMSSDGPDHYYPGYDYVAASKAALEAFITTVAPALSNKGGRIFGLRARQVDTTSLAQIFPPEIHGLLTRRFAWFRVTTDNVAEAAVVLCSGLLDGLHGQVLCADKGASFHDNFIATLPLLKELSA
jgi:NAD(P)-dependent dehydrogenase (short-subunit alcohol dehydrogenase family)